MRRCRFGLGKAVRRAETGTRSTRGRGLNGPGDSAPASKCTLWAQKVAAQALPVVEALGGAAVYYAFTEHSQDVARGHFTVHRLELVYGKEQVRVEYNLCCNLSGRTSVDGPESSGTVTQEPATDLFNRATRRCSICAWASP